MLHAPQREEPRTTSTPSYHIGRQTNRRRKRAAVFMRTNTACMHDLHTAQYDTIINAACWEKMHNTMCTHTTVCLFFCGTLIKYTTNRGPNSTPRGGFGGPSGRPRTSLNMRRQCSTRPSCRHQDKRWKSSQSKAAEGMTTTTATSARVVSIIILLRDKQRDFDSRSSTWRPSISIRFVIMKMLRPEPKANELLQV